MPGSFALALSLLLGPYLDSTWKYHNSHLTRRRLSQKVRAPQKEQQKDTTKTEKDTITTLGNLDIWAYEKLHCLDPQGA